MIDDEIRRGDATAKRWVFLIIVLISLGIGAIISLLPLFGYSRLEDALEVLKGWSEHSGYLVAFVLGYYYSKG